MKKSSGTRAAKSDMIKASYWQYNQSAPEEVLRLDQCDLTSDAFTYMHYHNCIELGVCITGAGECRTDEQIYAFSAGDMQIFYPFQNHLSRSFPETPSRWYFISIDPNGIMGRFLHMDTRDFYDLIRNKIRISGIFSPGRYPELADIINRILDEMKDAVDKSYHIEMIAAYTCELLMTLARLSENVHTAPPAVHIQHGFSVIQPALDILGKHDFSFAEIRVAELAKKCGLSESRFRCIFKTVTGSSPKEYINELQLHSAEYLLAHTGLSVLEISERSGFSDVSCFFRSFVRKHGVSPSRYRRRFGLGSMEE